MICAVVGPKDGITIPYFDYKRIEDHLNDPSLQFYFYGEIRYNDVFPDTLLHVTKFCFKIALISTPPDRVGAIDLCSHWNCADEECHADKARYDKELSELVEDIKSKPPEQ